MKETNEDSAAVLKWNSRSFKVGVLCRFKISLQETEGLLTINTMTLLLKFTCSWGKAVEFIVEKNK